MMGGYVKNSFLAVLFAAAALLAVPASAEVWHLVNPRPTPETLKACVYSSATNSYVAVGERGTVLTSSDGSAWQLGSSGTTQTLYSVASDGTRFVAVGGTGTVLVSTDGASWSSHSISDGGTLTDVIWDGSQFVAVRMYSSVWTSSNGESWTMKAVPEELGGFYPQSITFDGSAYIAVGPDGFIATSPDLTNWTEQISPDTYNGKYGVAAHGGTIVIVGENGVILRSLDGGVTWTTASSAPVNGVAFKDVYHDGSQFVAVGYDMANNMYGRLYVSSDGDSWTDALDQAAEQTDKNFWGICGNAGTSVAVGNGGIVETSSNGSDWVKRTPDLDHLKSIAHNNGSFVAVGENGAVLSSDNGADWTERISGTANRLTSVTYAGGGIGKFFAVGANGAILSSTAGITWAGETSGTITYFESVAASGTTIVASGQSGFIVTSSGGGTWNNHSITGETRSLYLRYLGNRFVAVTHNGPAYASDDGISWTQGDVAQMATAWNIASRDVGWDGTTYTNGFYRSGNGVNWTSCAQKVTFTVNGITHDGNQFIAVGASGKYATSPDGDTWTSGAAFASINLNSSQRLGSSTVIVGDYGSIFFNSSVVLEESGGTTAVTEGGSSDTYTMALASPPAHDVVVTLSADSQATPDAITLTFTPSDWNVPQTVTVGAVDDSVAEGVHAAVISHTITSSDASYHGITAPSVNVNITDNDYLLTYMAGLNGSIMGTISQTVSHGADGSPVTALPATTYYFVDWSDGLTTNPRTDTNVTGDISVTANFAIDTYTLTYTAGSNGSITGTSPQTVNHGADGSLVTAVPATGYHFVDWSDGSTTNARTDTNVTGDVSVTANFAVNTCTVTPSAGANGSLSPNTPQTINYNGTTSFTVTTNTGYRVDTVTGCGGTLSGSTYTTGPVTANCTVTASFTQMPANTGDLNSDGTVDSIDALKALRMAAGIDTITTADLQNGDVAPLVSGTPQPDGKIDIGDVVVVLRKAVGLVSW